jgi:DNA-binding MarR family transcriptional regulator
MASQGLVERDSIEGDRRALLIRLSPKGRKLFEAALPVVMKHYKRLLKGVDADEFETFMRVLRRLKANTRMLSDISMIEQD